MKKFASTLLWMFALTVALSSPSIACPMCKDSTPANTATKAEPASPPGLEFNKSIYFMLGGLFTALGLTSRVMYKAASRG